MAGQPPRPCRSHHVTRLLHAGHRGGAGLVRPRAALRLEDDANLRHLYQDTESADGYHRDLWVFDAAIDIEDTFQAQFRYTSGASHHRRSRSAPDMAIMAAPIL